MTQRFLVQNYPDQSAVDQAYDPDLRAVDLAAARAHITAQGEKARATLPHVLNVPYGPTLEETLDVFPAARPNAPVMVFLHGGYWRANQAHHFHNVVLGPVAAGFTTVVVNYALSPFVTLDEIVRQVRASLVWVRRNIAQYAGNPERVFVSGHSAGGQLTAMSLLTPWQRDYGLDDNWIAGGLAISGLFDLEALRFSYLQPLLQFDEGTVQRNSPARLVQPRSMPLALVYGALEQQNFADQSALMHQRWQAAGNRSQVQASEACDHFTVLNGFDGADTVLTRALLALAQA